MLSFFNKKTISPSKKGLNKIINFQHKTKIENLNKFNYTKEDQKTITLTNSKKAENSYIYRISTLPTESNEIPKKKYKVILTHRTLTTKNKKNNNLIGLFKNTLFSTKKILRPKTTSKRKFNKKKLTLDKEPNVNNIFKNYCRKEGKKILNEVPLSFIESMRLNTEQNLTKADLFLKQEKKRLLKENPNLKYQMQYYKKQEKKKEELEKINQFKIWKKYLKSNKKEYDNNKLNEYHTKSLLHENYQYFNDNKPIIDKTKFTSKYRLLTTDNKEEEKPKVFEFNNITNIFSKYLEEENEIKKEKFDFKKHKKISKKDVYKRFRIIIKKCAIEFRNIKIPFNEYIKYLNASKNIIKYLFKENYNKLLEIIKRAGGFDNNKKEKEVINYITRDKLLVYTIDFYGQSILFLSIKYKLYKSLSKIIQFGANINLQDFKGRTALHFASKFNDITAVTILLYYLADPAIKDNNDETPFDYALNNGYDCYIIKELLNRSIIIRKINKYRSWKEYDACIRRGIQYYLIHNLSKDNYNSIFSYIDNM